MKDCYEVSKKIKAIGKLDLDEDNNKIIYAELGKDRAIDFNTLIYSMIGQQIKIETSLDIE